MSRDIEPLGKNVKPNERLSKRYPQKSFEWVLRYPVPEEGMQGKSPKRTPSVRRNRHGPTQITGKEWRPTL